MIVFITQTYILGENRTHNLQYSSQGHQPLDQHAIHSINIILYSIQLLSGVNYTFNVTAVSVEDEDEEVTEKMFNIDNIKGDQKLMIEGRSDMFAISLVGGQMTYADLDFVLEAQVTACFKTYDYYVSIVL